MSNYIYQCANAIFQVYKLTYNSTNINVQSFIFQSGAINPFSNLFLIAKPDCAWLCKEVLTEQKRRAVEYFCKASRQACNNVEVSVSKKFWAIFAEQ